ncbi:hypothetical protein [Natronoflexus pectinivorans]|uniref:Lipoprotein n=1 Tax=Natronoflexus pectinivorans TaxID=682526 RepID=A0A4V2RX07_9BACT|nr:hypothetical protein [Natronoflexus pectinivorans]TCO10951.1 hypothetical protein EV194_101585 [Natronoflexus pectinivorans]
MIKNLFFVLLILAGFQLFSGCKGCSDADRRGSDELVLPDSLITDAPLKLSEEIMNEVIGNISSPVEMANLFKASGVEFTQRILNDPDNVSRYQTSFKRALNLGVFSADLGYINTFDKSNIVVSYLLAVNSLADGIRVGQFFDFNSLRRMASSSSNLDSLMEMSVSSFNRMDNYLREQNRSNVSTLIVTGAWIEGLWIATNVVRQSGDKDLKIRIAEQKNVINILEIILSNYTSEPNFAELAKDIARLKEAYVPIRITTELGDPQRIEQDGVLIFIQDEVSTVHYTDEDLENIMTIIEEIRTKIIS